MLQEQRVVFSIRFILSKRLVYVHALHFLPTDANRQLLTEVRFRYKILSSKQITLPHQFKSFSRSPKRVFYNSKMLLNEVLMSVTSVNGQGRKF